MQISQSNMRKVFPIIGFTAVFLTVLLFFPIALPPIFLAGFLCFSSYKKRLVKNGSVGDKGKFLYGVVFVVLSGAFLALSAVLFLFARSYNNSGVTQRGTCEKIYEPMREQIMQGGWEWNDFGRTREEYETLEKQCQ